MIWKASAAVAIAVSVLTMSAAIGKFDVPAAGRGPL